MKQIARENNKLDDKHLNREVAERMTSPHYFTDRVLQVGFNVTLESHQMNHSISKSFIKPIYREFEIEVRYDNTIIKELSANYAR